MSGEDPTAGESAPAPKVGHEGPGIYGSHERGWPACLLKRQPGLDIEILALTTSFAVALDAKHVR